MTAVHLLLLVYRLMLRTSFPFAFILGLAIVSWGMILRADQTSMSMHHDYQHVWQARTGLRFSSVLGHSAPA